MSRILLSFFLFLCLSGAASAEEKKDIRIVCGNSTASVKIWTENDRFIFRLDDAVGFKNFPLYSGVVTAMNAPLIERGLKELQIFDKLVIVSWDRKSCRFDPDKPFLVDCTGRGTIESPRTEDFHSSGMSTTIEKQARLDFSYDTLKIDLGLDTKEADYAHYFLAFPFNKQNCQLTYP